MPGGPAANPPKPRFSLGFQLGLLVAAAVLVSIAVWTAGTYVLARHYLRESVSQRVLAYARDVSALAGHFGPEELAERRELLRPLLDRLLEDPGVRYVRVYGPRKERVLAQPSAAAPDLGPASSAWAPVRDDRGGIAGWVRVWYSADALWSTVWSRGRHPLLVIACVTAVGLGGAVYLGCWLLVFRPIERILEKRRAGGAASGGADGNELGSLLRRYNNLERKLAESEENLSVLLSASRMMMSELDIREIHNRVLDLVWRRLDRDPCLLWWQDEDAFLRIKNFRNFPPGLVKRLRFEPGKGGPGSCFESRQPVVEKDVRSSTEEWVQEVRKDADVRCAAHFPLVVDGRSAGVLTAFSRDPNFFNEERSRMIASLMDYLSVTTKGARLFEEMQGFGRRMESEVAATTRELAQTNVRLIKRVRELRALYDLSALTAGSTAAGDVVAKTLDHVADLLEAERAAVFVWDEARQAFVSDRPLFPEAAQTSAAVSAESLGPWREKLASGAGVLLSRPEDLSALFPSAPAASALLSPVVLDGALSGFLAAANRRSGPFEEEDLRVGLLFTRHLSEGLRATQLRQERERRLKELTALQDLSSVMTSEPVLSRTLREAARVVAAAFSADVCAFLLYDAEKNELVTQPGAFGLPEGEEPLFYRVPADSKSSINARVFHDNRPMVSPDAQADQRINPHYAKLWNVRSLIVAPLFVEGKPIGVMRIGHRQPRVFREDSLPLAGLMAEQAAVIVENAKLYQQIQENVKELKRLNNMKSEFLSMVSHELRTPLAALKGFLGVLLNEQAGPVGPQQKRFLALSQQSLNRLAFLINDLVDTSYVEVGKLHIAPEPMSLKEILEQAHRDHLATSAEKKIALEMEPLPDVPSVEADPRRIRQVVDNLIVNALKFTPEGGRVTLFLKQTDEGVLAGVRDTGIGIEPEEQQKVFDKFYRVKSASSMSVSGVGLGLAICRSLIELHGGRIWVESRPGEGAAFQFVLPRKAVQAGQAGGAARA